MNAAQEILEIEIGEAVLRVPKHIAAQTYLRSIIEAPAPRTAISNIPNIGDFWPGQGGINAGLMRGENGSPDYFLIVPTDPTAYCESITWGGRGKEEPESCSTFDGLANTRALAASKQSHPAAEWAATLTIDGHSDFYLPARRELRLCWVNVPELFVDGWHWSSTQCSAYGAWCQDFGDGDQYSIDKVSELRARAVRRFVNPLVI